MSDLAAAGDSGAAESSDLSDLGRPDELPDGEYEPATGEESKETTPESQETETAEDDDDDSDDSAGETAKSNKQVPLTALQAERHKRREAERRAAIAEGRASAFAESNRPQKPGDSGKAPTKEQLEAEYWADPTGFTQRQVHEAVYQDRLARSLEQAKEAHADFAEAEAAFIEATRTQPHLVQSLRAHHNPAEYAYQTGRAFIVAKDAGGSIDGLRKKIEAELRPQIEAEVKKQFALKTAAGIPKTTAGARGRGETAAQSEEVWNGPTPMKEIFGRKRRA